MKPKKLPAFLLAAVLLLSLCACGGTKTEQTKLTVFAAASLTETLTEIADAYTALHPEVEIIFNFDSSGTLKTQIEEGADCDVFISASPKQMDSLSGYVDRFNLLENRIALIVPEGNSAGLASFDDLAARLKEGSILLSMGNSDVPVGQYTQKILAYCGLDEAALAAAGAITYSSNVKEITTQVSEAVVDCGIVYQTDAYSAGLTVVDTATEEMCGQVIYPAAVLKGAAHPEAAREFLNYLTSAEASAVFETVGFTPIA